MTNRFSPQAHVFEIVRAILSADTATVDELFRQVGEANRWPVVAVIALSEVSEEVREHDGDDALVWLTERLRTGLDPGG